MKVALVKPEQKNILDMLTFIDVDGSLDDYYKYCECSTITITCRKIGGVWFDIICDDEGLLVGKSLSAVRVEGGEIVDGLVGNLIIAHSEEGVTTPLRDEDIALLHKYVGRISKPGGEPCYCIELD